MANPTPRCSQHTLWHFQLRRRWRSWGEESQLTELSSENVSKQYPITLFALTLIFSNAKRKHFDCWTLPKENLDLPIWFSIWSETSEGRWERTLGSRWWQRTLDPPENERIDRWHLVSPKNQLFLTTPGRYSDKVQDCRHPAWRRSPP